MSSTATEKVLHRATATARHFLQAAALDIEAQFGPGWARGNPEVVVAYMTACIHATKLAGAQKVSRK